MKSIGERLQVTGRFLFALSVFIFAVLHLHAQSSATSTIPVSIGKPCGASAGSTDSVMYFTFSGSTSTISRLSACRPRLASPGISSSRTSVSFNPADRYLYMAQYKWVNGDYNSYVWRWDPSTCPNTTLSVYQTYNDYVIAGLEFDASGIGYQIEFTGSSAPYGIALQRVDFTNGTIGTSIDIDLQGKKIYTQNGDFVITPSGQFLMVWDNKYFSLNYHDYNTSNPLVATFIDSLVLPGNKKMVGLSFAQGKLIGSASNCSYYSFNILTGGLTPVAKTTGAQYSTDMTNIASGIGAAKKLVSATPVTAGVYDLVYDITVKNYGDYPVSGVQVVEDLTALHPSGASVISNVSSEWISNPSGIILNTSYDGVTDKNLISTNPSQTLPNYPTSDNYFVIRVKFRLSSVVTGVVYNNSAVVTAVGYNSIALADSSTNGEEPDLNNNNIPDDVGENQPTPFSVSAASESPPCASINTILYAQNFGSGTGIGTTLPGTVTTQYGAGSNPMDEETYVLTNNANNGNTSKYVNLSDHTANTNGRMLLVNADVQNYIIFEDVVNVSCVNLKYSFLVYAANAANASYRTFCGAFGGSKQPKLTLVVRNAADNSIISNITTTAIADSSWNVYGLKWVMPEGVASVKLQVYNSGEGGCGNVVALDDVQFGICDPLPAASALPSAGCLGMATTINALLTDTINMSDNLQYQWQSSSNGTSGWADIAGAANASYTINPFTAADEKFYRIIVAANGNLGSTCQYASNGIYLTAKDSSTAPISAISDKSYICPGQSAELSVNGGSLGDNAVWKWYTSSCGGVYENTGSPITVYPTGIATTYYVRAEGDCNTTECASVTVPLTCTLASETTMLKGSLASREVNLFCTIVSDIQLQFIEVERSNDGVNFETTQLIPVNGFADKNGYTLKEDIASLRYRKVYYRIKATTLIGEVFYSNVQSFALDQVFDAVIVPNPARTNARIEFHTASSSRVIMQVFTAQGRLLQSAAFNAKEGYNSYMIDGAAKLSSGIYFITITCKNLTKHLRLIVQ